ncbi:hypothetical protein [Aquimarina intermedia]|uniref:Uncharacterized protein n=1 Tax=Aquimarina intermedia TaxID=350814 RepID=A0A5S5C984_9FLAO|nr:hypothetical protein [Aquimarina intermedia]TYP75178.1 hypothetical protein BD809_103242 [Aquimarina intermedia]
MMKKLLILLLLLPAIQFAQCLSDTKVIYEYRDQIILNDGLAYKVVEEKHFYQISDPSIAQHQEVGDLVLRLNRVLILWSEELDKTKRLIEWVRPSQTYYVCSDYKEDAVIANKF